MQNSIKKATLHRAARAFYKDPVFEIALTIILFYNSLQQNPSLGFIIMAFGERKRIHLVKANSEKKKGNSAPN